jgi:hypothetical protein
MPGGEIGDFGINVHADNVQQTIDQLDKLAGAINNVTAASQKSGAAAKNQTPSSFTTTVNSGLSEMTPAAAGRIDTGYADRMNQELQAVRSSTRTHLVQAQQDWKDHTATLAQTHARMMTTMEAGSKAFNDVVATRAATMPANFSQPLMFAGVKNELDDFKSEVYKLTRLRDNGRFTAGGNAIKLNDFVAPTTKTMDNYTYLNAKNPNQLSSAAYEDLAARAAASSKVQAKIAAKPDSQESIIRTEVSRLFREERAKATADQRNTLSVSSAVLAGHLVEDPNTVAITPTRVATFDPATRGFSFARQTADGVLPVSNAKAVAADQARVAKILGDQSPAEARALRDTLEASVATGQMIKTRSGFGPAGPGSLDQGYYAASNGGMAVKVGTEDNRLLVLQAEVKKALDWNTTAIQKETAGLERAKMISNNKFLPNGTNRSIDLSSTVFRSGQSPDYRFFQKGVNGSSEILNTPEDQVRWARAQSLNTYDDRGMPSNAGGKGPLNAGLASLFGGTGSGDAESSMQAPGKLIFDAAKSMGRVVKYNLINQAVFGFERAMKEELIQGKDYANGLTDLRSAARYNSSGVFGSDSSSTSLSASSEVNSFIDQTSNFSRLAGSNVGDSLDAAARGMRAFGNESGMTAEEVKAVGVATAQVAGQLSVIANKSLVDATGDIVAIGKGFNLSGGDLKRIPDAIAYAKNKYGGDQGQIAQGAASFAEVAQTSGLTIYQASNLISSVVGTIDESGSAAAQRLSRIFSTLTGRVGRELLQGLQININQPAGDQLKALAAKYKTLNLTQQGQIRNTIGGTGSTREFEAILNSAALNDPGTNAGGQGLNAFIQRSNDLTGMLKKVVGDYRNIQIDVVRSGLLTPIGALLSSLESILRLTDEVLKKFNDFASILGPFQGVIGSVLSLTAALRVLKAVLSTESMAKFGTVFGGTITGRAAGAVGSSVFGQALGGNALGAFLTQHGMGRPALGPMTEAEATAASASSRFGRTGRFAGALGAASLLGGSSASGAAGMASTALMGASVMQSLAPGMFAALSTGPVLAAVVAAAAGKGFFDYSKMRTTIDHRTQMSANSIGSLSGNSTQGQIDVVINDMKRYEEEVKQSGGIFVNAIDLFSHSKDKFKAQTDEQIAYIQYINAEVIAKRAASASTSELSTTLLLFGRFAVKTADDVTQGIAAMKAAGYSGAQQQAAVEAALAPLGKPIGDPIMMGSGLALQIPKIGASADALQKHSDRTLMDKLNHSVGQIFYPSDAFASNAESSKAKSAALAVTVNARDKKLADDAQSLVADAYTQTNGGSIAKMIPELAKHLEQESGQKGSARTQWVAQVAAWLRAQDTEQFGSTALNAPITPGEFTSQVGNLSASRDTAVADLRTGDLKGATKSSQKALTDLLNLTKNTPQANIALGNSQMIAHFRDDLFTKQFAEAEQLKKAAVASTATTAGLTSSVIKIDTNELTAAALSGNAQNIATVLSGISGPLGRTVLMAVEQSLGLSEAAIAALRAAGGPNSTDLLAALTQRKILLEGQRLATPAAGDPQDPGVTSGNTLAGARNGGALAIARAERANAGYTLSKANTASERNNAAIALVKAEKAYSDALLTQNQTLALTAGDFTNPVVVAQQDLKLTLGKLAYDKKNQRGLVPEDTLAVKQKQVALTKTALDQTMQKYGTLYDLNEISYSAYSRYLYQEKIMLARHRHDSFAAEKAYEDVATAYKSLTQGGDRQWNFGTIKLPSPYELRRFEASNGGTGQTVININGADTGKVMSILNTYLGPVSVGSQGTTSTKK